MRSLQQRVLRADVSGMPLEWIDYQEAVRIYHLGRVAYSCGHVLYRIRGGLNAVTGLRTVIAVSSIIATCGDTKALVKARRHYVPPLNNPTLFKRDAFLCMYCGERHLRRDLSRDHVTPLSKGGRDSWNNVVTACKRCNNQKSGRTPEEAGMELVAVPFSPTHAEYVYLQGRKILADQMEFLLSHFPRSSPLHARVTRSVH